MLLDIYTHHASLVRLIREFGTRADFDVGAATDTDMSRQLSLLDL